VQIVWDDGIAGFCPEPSILLKVCSLLHCRTSAKVSLVPNTDVRKHWTIGLFVRQNASLRTEKPGLRGERRMQSYLLPPQYGFGLA
jgi:hypothetical protein